MFFPDIGKALLLVVALVLLVGVIIGASATVLLLR